MRYIHERNNTNTQRTSVSRQFHLFKTAKKQSLTVGIIVGIEKNNNAFGTTGHIEAKLTYGHCFKFRKKTSSWLLKL